MSWRVFVSLSGASFTEAAFLDTNDCGYAGGGPEESSEFIRAREDTWVSAYSVLADVCREEFKLRGSGRGVRQ